jgi:hypothetical protein
MEETPAAFPPGPPPIEPPSSPPPEVIPWEQPGRPWAGALIETVRLLVTSPRAAYERVPVRGDVLRPILFALILGWFGLVLSSMWELTLGNAMRGIMPRPPGDAATPPRVLYFAMMLLGPLVAACVLLLSSALMHVALLLVGGARNGFVATLRAASYAQAANVGMILPFCGGLLATVGLVVLEVIGLSVLHRISLGKAILGVLLPAVACCACVATLAAMFGAALMAAFGGMAGLGATP